MTKSDNLSFSREALSIRNARGHGGSLASSRPQSDPAGGHHCGISASPQVHPNSQGGEARALSDTQQVFRFNQATAVHVMVDGQDPVGDSNHAAVHVATQHPHAPQGGLASVRPLVRALLGEERGGEGPVSNVLAEGPATGGGEEGTPEHNPVADPIQVGSQRQAICLAKAEALPHPLLGEKAPEDNKLVHSLTTYSQPAQAGIASIGDGPGVGVLAYANSARAGGTDSTKPVVMTEVQSGSNVPETTSDDLPHEGYRVARPAGDEIPDFEQARSMQTARDCDSNHLKIGDHSVHTVNIIDVLAVDYAETYDLAPNFITKASQCWTNFISNVFLSGDELQISIRSFLSKSMIGGGLHEPTQIEADVFYFTADAPPPNSLIPMYMRAGAPLVESSFPKDALTGFFVGATPSERLVSSMANVTLGMTNTLAIRSLSQLATANMEIHSAVYLYTKLAHAALVYEICTYANHDPELTPFPELQTIRYIDVTENNEQPGIAIRECANRGDLILVEGVDYHPGDGMLLRYLRCAGVRFQANNNWFHGSQVNWQSIMVAVVLRGPPPNQPAAAATTASIIWQFIHKLASSRGEWTAARKGLYAAFECVGLKYAFAEGPPARSVPLRTDMSPAPLSLPKFVDYSLMCRLASIRPPLDHDALGEMQAFMAMSNKQKVLTAGLYDLGIASAASTLLLDLNLTKQMIVNWCQGVEVQYSSVTAIVSGATMPNQAHGEAFMHMQIRAVMAKWMDTNPVLDLFLDSPWLGRSGTTPLAPIAYQDCVNGAIPSLRNPWSLNTWLDRRPIEWGLCSPGPSLNFSKEVKIHGEDAVKGWYSHLGDKSYADRACGPTPYLYVPYGFLALNAIYQHLEPALEPTLSAVRASWEGPGSDRECVSWDRPQAYVPAQDWVDDLSAFAPFRITTYDYATSEVVAICATVDPEGLENGQVITLKQLDNARCESVGVANGYRAQRHEPQAVTLPLLFGRGSLRDTKAAEAPATNKPNTNE